MIKLRSALYFSEVVREVFFCSMSVLWSGKLLSLKIEEFQEFQKIERYFQFSIPSSALPVLNGIFTKKNAIFKLSSSIINFFPHLKKIQTDRPLFTLKDLFEFRTKFKKQGGYSKPTWVCSYSFLRILS